MSGWRAAQQEGTYRYRAQQLSMRQQCAQAARRANCLVGGTEHSTASSQKR